MFIGLNFGLVGEPVTIDKPAAGDPLDQPLFKDLDLQIAASTASTSTLVVSIRRCNADAKPTIELDSASGLTIVSGVGVPTPSAGSVVWESTQQVILHLAASTFSHLRPGQYNLELTELTLAGRVISRYTQQLHFHRPPGHRIS